MSTPLSADLGVKGNTVTVLETDDSVPRPPEISKTYTFQELRETFDYPCLVIYLLDEVERLREYEWMYKDLCK